MRWEELCEMSCVSCEMSGNTWDELCELWDEWSSVNELCELWDDLCERTWVKLMCENTKAAPPNATQKQLLSELSCGDDLSEMSCVRWVVWIVRWEELCELWHERSCVRRVLWVVRWVELCEMSCVSCEMRGVVWDELCELWDELCERTWVKLMCENTKAAPPNATQKQLLSELSCVRWVVRDELCQISCVTYEMRGVVWNELC